MTNEQIEKNASLHMVKSTVRTLLFATLKSYVRYSKQKDRGMMMYTKGAVYAHLNYANMAGVMSPNRVRNIEDFLMTWRPK